MGGSRSYERPLEGKCIYLVHYKKYICHHLLVYKWYANYWNRINHVYETKRFLSSNFNMKDLGEVKVILGIKITRIPNELKLS